MAFSCMKIKFSRMQGAKERQTHKDRLLRSRLSHPQAITDPALD